MNPDPRVMAYVATVRDRERRDAELRHGELHRRAVARRRKAKRGGKR